MDDKEVYITEIYPGCIYLVVLYNLATRWQQKTLGLKHAPEIKNFSDKS